jgi:hypothetical protein
VDRIELLHTRRYFFGRAAAGLGIPALASLLERQARGSETPPNSGLPGLPHFPPKAKRVIFLFQSGGPSQMDLFDYKPTLRTLERTELSDSIRKGQRLTGMTSGNRASRLRLPHSNSNSTENPAHGSVSYCRTSAAWSTMSALSSRCARTRSITTLP